jgi:hypothetical protein
VRPDLHAEARESQASLALVLSGALGVQGLLISFVPGPDVPWYAITALIACGGLRSRRWPRRALAAGLCLGFAVLALLAWRHHDLRKAAGVQGSTSPPTVAACNSW